MTLSRGPVCPEGTPSVKRAKVEAICSARVKLVHLFPVSVKLTLMLCICFISSGNDCRRSLMQDMAIFTVLGHSKKKHHVIWQTCIFLCLEKQC